VRGSSWGLSRSDPIPLGGRRKGSFCVTGEHASLVHGPTDPFLESPQIPENKLLGGAQIPTFPHQLIEEACKKIDLERTKVLRRQVISIAVISDTR
jgi:hypothetical protein